MSDDRKNIMWINPDTFISEKIWPSISLGNELGDSVNDI